MLLQEHLHATRIVHASPLVITAFRVPSLCRRRAIVPAPPAHPRTLAPSDEIDHPHRETRKTVRFVVLDPNWLGHLEVTWTVFEGWVGTTQRGRGGGADHKCFCGFEPSSPSYERISAWRVSGPQAMNPETESAPCRAPEDLLCGRNVHFFHPWTS